MLHIPRSTKSLIAGYLDPRLARDAHALTFFIDLAEQVQWKVDIHALFRDMSIGKVGRDIFSPLRAFRDRLDILDRFRVVVFGVHRLDIPVGLHAMP